MKLVEVGMLFHLPFGVPEGDVDGGPEAEAAEVRLVFALRALVVASAVS